MNTSTSGASRAKPSHRRRFRAVAVSGAAIVVVGIAAAVAYGVGGSPEKEPMASRLPPATAEVTNATLTQTERVGGTLSYGTPVTVTARSGTATAAGSGAGSGSGGGTRSGSGGTPSAGDSTSSGASTPGTLTWLAPIGSVVKRGQAIYRVDDRPVVLWHGATTMYRELRSGLTGAEVKQLEENLKALGYTGFTVDTEFTASTATAVKAWQEDLGRDETGTVDVDEVVIAPGDLRVAEHKATTGSQASGAVLTYTGTIRVVSVALDVAKQHLVKAGLAATVTLPDGKTVNATVSRVGTVASTSAEQQPQQSSTTIDVTVEVADQVALGTLDSAPVDLTLVVSRRENVLTVPVAALVALAEGGYGVQVVEGQLTRYAAVTAGMFANGRVEISGGGIAAGMLVGVPT